MRYRCGVSLQRVFAHRGPRLCAHLRVHVTCAFCVCVFNGRVTHFRDERGVVDERREARRIRPARIVVEAWAAIRASGDVLDDVVSTNPQIRPHDLYAACHATTKRQRTTSLKKLHSARTGARSAPMRTRNVACIEGVE